MNYLELLEPVNEQATVDNTMKLLNRLDHLANLASVTISSVKYRIGSNPTPRDDAQVNRLNRIVMARNMIDAIIATVNKLSDKHKKLITLFFLEPTYISTVKVARELGYSTRQIQRMKRQALIEFADKWESTKITYHIDLTLYTYEDA